MVRIGCVPYLNAYPLWRSLPEVPTFAPPSGLYQWMAAGQGEVALLPVAALLYHPEWIPVSTTGIASRGPVQSVTLFHRVPIEKCRIIILDPESLTSNLLLKVILKDKFLLDLNKLRFISKVRDSFFCHSRESGNPGFQESLDPRFRGDDIGVASKSEELSGVDAILMIGDKALKTEMPGWQTLDLATAWHELTGLPMVFARWLGRPIEGTTYDSLARILDAGLDRSFLEIETWLDQMAVENSILKERLEKYFKVSLEFRLTDVHERGLQTFLSRAQTVM